MWVITESAQHIGNPLRNTVLEVLYYCKADDYRYVQIRYATDLKKKPNYDDTLDDRPIKSGMFI